MASDVYSATCYAASPQCRQIMPGGSFLFEHCRY
jgi:hypothetical protein